MYAKKIALSVAAFVILSPLQLFAQTPFVRVEGKRFFNDRRPYYFIGTNYWYGSLLGLEKDRRRGVERLCRELDFLKANGVNNLRLMAGAEGAGLINGVERVGPPLQPEQGKFDEKILEGLDLVLYEMGNRDMKAVIFLSNNWEWSGGFQQYLIWNGLVEEDRKTRRLEWDELRDVVSRFYGCGPCKKAYYEQVKFIIGRTNKYTKKRYADDPAIMAWELANEPRPMRPAANEAYKKWVAEAAALIKSMDKNHLVTLGHEGRIGTEDMKLFEEIHSDPNVDYLTIHIWAKNWRWFEGEKLAEGFPLVLEKAEAYIKEHTAVAEKLEKPLVIEEFGLPRDGHSFDPASTTKFRDEYFARIFSFLAASARSGGPLAGANFWAFGGRARPVKDQVFWKKGDEYMGDPPMEEQGLNTVFDSDKTTWTVIKKYAEKMKNGKRKIN